MKLRILGDSVRLRLSQSDVRTLLRAGSVQEETHFGGESVLSYAVERSKSVDGLEAQFDAGRILVRIPDADVERWGSSNEVSLAGEQPVAGARVLSLLVEKDFKCVVPRPGEEDYDGFEHPGVSC